MLIKKSSTLFLKTVIFLMGFVVITLGLTGLPFVGEFITKQNHIWGYAHVPLFLGMYISMIPFFFALYQTFKLLSYIDKNHAFSKLSVQTLKKIKYLAFIFSVLYLLMMPFFYLIGETDDAPGVILIGLILIFASLVLGVFAAVLERLLQDALEIKTENDLTV